MLKIHSVVQDFFVDSLRASGELPYWLTQAIILFCASYSRADSYIKAKGTTGLVEDYRRYDIHAVRLLEHVKRIEKTTRLDNEIKGRLITTLQSLQEEIEGRTPASSQQIARGRPDPYQVSIFDRTSSSSDTPDTPGNSDRRSTGISTTNLWGLESMGEHFQSPSSITHETSHVTVESDLSRSAFPPLPREDKGYETDDDLNMSENNTVRGDDTGNSSGQWQTVPLRGGGKRKPKPAKLLWHRTIRDMDRGRYSDTVGSWRSMATDPRVRNVAVRGTFRSQSRGRSGAEEALSNITAKSPPPPRGGGVFIRDRGQSSTRSAGSEPRKIMFMPRTYAAAAAPRPDSSHLQPGRGYGSPQGSATIGISATPHVFSGDSERGRSNDGQTVRPNMSTALKSLQSIPTLKNTRQQNQMEGHERRPTNPPPSFTYQLPYPPSDDSLPKADPVSEPTWINPPTYGRNTNPLPFESIAPLPSPALRKRGFPHDDPSWQSNHYPETTSSSPGPSFSSFASPHLSAWSPSVENSSFDNKPLHESQYLDNYSHGYTSQPMSRDPSGQSVATNVTAIPEHIARRRRHSLAETEPAPYRASFSSPIPQPRNLPHTSFYDQRAEVRRGSIERPLRRKSPRLGSTMDASMDGITSTTRSPIYNMPTPEVHRSYPDIHQNTSFNPTAPAFRPRIANRSSIDYNNSSSNKSNIVFSNVGSQFQRPTPKHFYSQPNEAFVTEAPEMGRTSSGGIRVGDRYVQFGEYPAPDASFDTFPSMDRSISRDGDLTRSRGRNQALDSRDQDGRNRMDWERAGGGVEHMSRTSSNKDIPRYGFGGGRPLSGASAAGAGDGRGYDRDMRGAASGSDSNIDTRERSLSSPERTMSRSGSGTTTGLGLNFEQRVQNRDHREYGIPRR